MDLVNGDISMAEILESEGKSDSKLYHYMIQSVKTSQDIQVVKD